MNSNKIVKSTKKISPKSTAFDTEMKKPKGIKNKKLAKLFGASATAKKGIVKESSNKKSILNSKKEEKLDTTKKNDTGKVSEIIRKSHPANVSNVHQSIKPLESTADPTKSDSSKLLNKQEKEVHSSTSEKKQEPKKVIKKVVKLTPNSMCRQLLLERQYTDDEIVAKILKVFPEKKFTRSYVSTTRLDLNKGYYKGNIVEVKIIRYVRIDGVLTDYNTHKSQIDAETERKRKERNAKNTNIPVPEKALNTPLPLKK